MTESTKVRVEQIDVARGGALVAMTLFHLGWDLEAFRFVEKGFASQPAMVWFARCIASSFLLLVGVSLVLAHKNGFVAIAFLKRFAMIAGAALLITIATYFATPNGVIFFGILHHIATASVLGLLFLKLPWMTNIAIAGLVIALPLFARTPLLDAPIWWWSGMQQVTPNSNDYVPIFPFLAAVLFGIAIMQFGLTKDWDRKLSTYQPNNIVSKTLKFIGQHSLIYYLVHQPILIGILYIIHTLAQQL